MGARWLLFASDLPRLTTSGCASAAYADASVVQKDLSFSTLVYARAVASGSDVSAFSATSGSAPIDITLNTPMGDEAVPVQLSASTDFVVRGSRSVGTYQLL
jgi:hypothetical protein